VNHCDPSFGETEPLELLRTINSSIIQYLPFPFPLLFTKTLTKQKYILV
jgi:hypothetical protein